MRNRNLKRYLGGSCILLFLILCGILIFNVSTGQAEEMTSIPVGGNLGTNQKDDNQLSQTSISNNDANVIRTTATSLVIPGADFHSDGFFPESTFFSFSTGALEGTSSGDGCLVAPAYLPDDVTIMEFSASFIDNDSGNHINFDLYRVSNETGVVENLAYINTTSFSESPNIEKHSTTFISNPLVDYPTYAYYVATCLPTENTKLFGIQIFYTHP